jgi:membrane protease YdiL (CAAX protease family)
MIYFFIWFAVMLLFGMAQVAVVETMFGKGSATAMSDADFATKHLWFYRIFQSLSSIFMFLVPPLLFALFYRQKPHYFLRLRFSPAPNVLLIIVAIVLSALPFIFYTLQLNQLVGFPPFLKELEQSLKQSEEGIGKLTQALMVMKGPQDLAFNLIMFALLPALAEEFFFRGGMQRLFGRAFKDPHIAIFITAIIFSAIHMQFYGFLPRFVLGVMFGYMYYWSRNLWVPVFAHMIYNGLQVVAVYAINMQQVDDIEGGGTTPFSVVLLSAILLFLTMSWLYRRTAGETELANDAE